MSDKIIENNQVTVIGTVVSEFTYSHEVFGEGFYMVDILVRNVLIFGVINTLMSFPAQVDMSESLYLGFRHNHSMPIRQL